MRDSCGTATLVNRVVYEVLGVVAEKRARMSTGSADGEGESEEQVTLSQSRLYTFQEPTVTAHIVMSGHIE